jgi:FkbM family methyltransferase
MAPRLRDLIKKPLNLLGLDVVQYQPRYALGQYAHLTSLEINTVIDVGAHRGEFALMIKKLLPGAAVISFEPQKEEFQALQKQLSGIPGCRTFNYALGDQNGAVGMHRSEYSPSSSLLPMAELHKQAFPYTARQTTETVEIRRLDDLAAEFTLIPEILLKIDVQGFEDRVIMGASSIVSRAKALIVEVSFRELYQGQPLFDDIYEQIKARGFAYSGNLYQLLNPSNGEALQADALFIRR